VQVDCTGASAVWGESGERDRILLGSNI